jgi:hypothetical protein
MHYLWVSSTTNTFHDGFVQKHILFNVNNNNKFYIQYCTIQRDQRLKNNEINNNVVNLKHIIIDVKGLLG